MSKKPIAQTCINLQNDIDKFINFCLQIDLIEFIYFSIEIHGMRQEIRELKDIKNLTFFQNIQTMVGLPHIHGILAIRSILGIQFHKKVLNNLQNFFLDPIFFPDILITSLIFPLEKEKTFYNIKKYWNYLTKEQNYNNHYFIIFSLLNNSLYNSFFDLILFFKFYIFKINFKYYKNKKSLDVCLLLY